MKDDLRKKNDFFNMIEEQLYKAKKLNLITNNSELDYLLKIFNNNLI